MTRRSNLSLLLLLLLPTALPAAPRPMSAVNAIADVEDRRAAEDPRLAVWIKSPSRAIRTRAAQAMGRIGAPALLPALLPALQDSDPGVRATACFSAGLIADSAALEPLRDCLQDSDAEVRSRAVEALSRLGTRRSAPLLAGMLRDSERAVGYEAAVGLWRLQDSSGVDSTLGLLADRDPQMRWRAVYALERSGSRRAPVAVRAMAADPDFQVRMIAARALGRMKDFPGGDLLSSALKDPSWQVRVNAAVSLGQLADSAQGPNLIGALSDSAGYVRQSAATALGAMRFSGALGALQKMRTDSCAACRGAAGVALVKIWGPSSYSGIKEFLADTTEFVAAQILEALGGAKDRGAWDLAAWSLTRGTPRMKTAALSYFDGMRDGKSMPLILDALHSGDDLLAANAAETIGDSGDSSRVEEFQALYRRWPGDAHMDARLAAVNAAAKLYPTHEVPFFRAALKDANFQVREAAAEGLKRATGEVVPAAVLSAPLPAARRGWFAPSMKSIPDQAVIHTERGDIRIALERSLSPNTVANFVRLARRKYFDGIRWHRVVPNFVIQGGDPHGDGQGGPGYAIRCEMNGIGYETGRVGMALSGKDTGGSQFFITQSPQPHLNGRYTIFGRVVSGMDVVDRIQQGDHILSVRTASVH